MDYFHAHYLEAVLNPKKFLPRAIAQIKNEIGTEKFDSIAVTGISGMFGYLLAQRLKKNIVIVRKGSCHSSYKVEMLKLPEKYIVVDDLIETGNTLKRIKKEINKTWKLKDKYPKPEYVGYYLYHHELTGF